jgi:histidyl-tRNA synthetase
MNLKKKPVTGMKDILPREMEIRNYVMQQIRETYAKFGFTQIETPCVEHIENLNSKQGGENEKLIFKIMKRGEKLRLAEAKTEADLTDSGLRYDLTLPLSRYYANNANELPSPFKALQMGNASKVVPIDKLSVVITLVLAFVFLREQFTVKSAIGCILIGAGTLFMVL